MQTSIVMETTTLPMATAIHLIYSLFGHSCSLKHTLVTAYQSPLPISHHNNDVFDQLRECVYCVSKNASLDWFQLLAAQVVSMTDSLQF